MNLPLREVKASLSKLVKTVESGKEIIITRHGHPVARLTRIEKPRQPFRVNHRLLKKKSSSKKVTSAEQIIREDRDARG